MSLPQEENAQLEPNSEASQVEQSIERMKALEQEPLMGRYALKYTFDDAHKLLEHFRVNFSGGWVFRGQENASWGLVPTIERDVHESKWHDVEVQALRVFKFRAPLYLHDRPEVADDLSWLSLMRHYGGPTRLLDWTRSPYVGAFFAVAEMNLRDASAIWAIDAVAVEKVVIDWLGPSNSLTGLESLPEHFVKVFFGDTCICNPFVAPAEPSFPTERQVIQQALFLVPNATHWQWSFETCLKNVLRTAVEKNEFWLCKIEIAPRARDELLRELLKMNISYATLFPGLDGFARSLGTGAKLRPIFSGATPNGEQ